MGADESLFVRLDSKDGTVMLKTQYRMNKVITKLANALTYGGALECGNEKVAQAKLDLKLKTQKKWLIKALSPQIDQSVVFLNTGNVYDHCISKLTQSKDFNLSKLYEKEQQVDDEDEETENSKNRIYLNHCEAGIIRALVKEILSCNMKGSSIGIIAPYVMQVNLLKKTISQFNESIEINTVDQYQGRDKEIIIYSGTRTGQLPRASNNSRNFEILEDQRRLTVAITRAKYKLILIGDANVLNSYVPFKKLLENISAMNKINLNQGQMNFDWNEIISNID